MLIFPLGLNVSAILIYENKKCYFTIRLFSKLKLFAGYIEIKKDGVLIHYKNNKAKLILLSGAKNLNKNVKPLYDYHLTKLNLFIDYNSDDYLLNYTLAFLHSYLKNYINWFLYHKKPYLRFNSDVCVMEKKSFNIMLEFTILLNLLMIIISLIKILWGKLVYAKQ